MNILGRSEKIREMIRKRRSIIRWHRDQKGDDRCFLDDYRVWAMHGALPHFPGQMSSEAGMVKCREFYLYRRAELADPIPVDAITNPSLWDADIETMNYNEAFQELEWIMLMIGQHYINPLIPKRVRTLEDDRKLYAALPEKMPADFRLPPEEEFLGEAKPQVGCPAFWKSHVSCGKRCDLHKWGPCGK